MYASAGTDVVGGGEGADVLYGMGGADVMDGGAGDDDMVGDGGYTQTVTGDGVYFYYDYVPYARLIGIEIDLHITADKPSYGTYQWGATSWATDGTLTGGEAQVDYRDVIEGSSGNDGISGMGGNDALSGGAGNNVINGEDGSSYKKRSCSRIPLLARRPIRSKGRPIQRWRRLSTVQTGLYGSTAI